jgi:hypothetical protein
VVVDVSEEFVDNTRPPTPSIVVRTDGSNPLHAQVLGMIAEQVDQRGFTYPYPVKSDSTCQFTFSMDSIFKHGKSGILLDYGKVCQICCNLAEQRMTTNAESRGLEPRAPRVSAARRRAEERLRSVQPAIDRWQEENHIDPSLVESLRAALLDHWNTYSRECCEYWTHIGSPRVASHVASGCVSARSPG